jgi:hypothetical protein
MDSLLNSTRALKKSQHRCISNYVKKYKEKKYYQTVSKARAPSLHHPAVYDASSFSRSSPALAVIFVLTYPTG